MELWIRSQDKVILAKIDNIYINNNVVLYDHHEDRATLGVYSTKERALEVLDEIQNKITKFNLKTDYGCTDNVYEMPKE